jgi:hypothetical protein
MELLEIIKGYNEEKAALSKYPLVLENYTHTSGEERRKEAQARIDVIDSKLSEILDRIIKKASK